MIDFTRLASIPKILIVEGITDLRVIEASLNAGEKNGRWTGWRSNVDVQEVGGIQRVWDALDEAQSEPLYRGRVFALVDQDWRSSTQNTALQTKYGSQLFILPRIHIDNYFVDPAEIHAMLPPHHRTSFLPLQGNIHSTLPGWIQQGAIAKILFESGAEEFCGRGGYKLLRTIPIPTDKDILAHLSDIHKAIEPTTIFGGYQHYLTSFRASSTPYQHCIGGKFFFKTVVLPVLNRLFNQPENDWRRDLQNNFPDCPQDLVPVLQLLT